jgi:predicted Zn-dependent protease
MTPNPRRRGLVVLALLGAALVAALAGLAAVVAPGPTPPAASTSGPLERARAAYLERDLPGAERLLRDVLRNAPDDRAARRLLGRVLCDRGRLAEAKETYEALLKADAKDVDALRGLARALSAMGQPGPAVQWLQTAADLRKDDPSVWKELGLAQRDAGDSVGAFASIQKSLALDPEQADLSALLPQLLQAPPSAQAPGIPGRVNPFEAPAPARPDDPFRNANRPRPPGVDPLIPSGNRPR